MATEFLTVFVMESTGKYWIPVFNILEKSCTDRDGAIQMILLNLDNLSHVEKFPVDGGYSGERYPGQFQILCKLHFGCK